MAYEPKPYHEPNIDSQAERRRGTLTRLRRALAMAGAPLWGTVLGAALFLVLLAVVRGPLYVVFPASVYLPLHILAEVLAVVVGFAIFAVHWHVAVSQQLRQARALYLGAAFLAVALIDTLHVLAFPGMPGLVEAGTTERGIYYWLAARFWAAIALLLAVFIDPRSRHPLFSRGPLLVMNLLPVVGLLVWDTTVAGDLGLFYVEGVGLTPLKLAAEYVIIAISLVAAVLYGRMYEVTRDRSSAMLAGALALTVLSELAFTLYSTAYDTFNLLGHVYKVVAYYMIFDGLFVAALLRPYAQLDATMRDLAASNQELTRLRDHIQGELARTIRTLEQTSLAERRARQSAEALAHLARDIAARVHLTDLLDTLAGRTRAIFGADFVALAIVHSHGVTSWRAMSGNRSNAFTTTVFPRGKGMAGRAIAAGRPVVVERFGDDPDFPVEEFPVLSAEGARSALSVPIKVGGEPFGAFVIAFRREHAMTREEIAMAESVADHAAVAIQNARLYEEVDRRAAELDAVINSIADGVIVYDPAGNIVQINRAASDLLGYSATDLLEPISERVLVLNLADPQGRPLREEEIPLVRALRGETVLRQEMMIQRPDRSVHRVTVSAAPVLDAQGRMIGVVSTLHDITNLVEQERRREEFLRIVAHDIRQPLTIIHGQAQLLRHALTSGKTGRLESGVDAILTSSRRMNAMIRDLVDSTRLEMGRLELHKQPVDVVGFIAELLERMGGVMEAHRVRLEAAGGPGSEEATPLAHADPDRLERILANLISNALKYSRPGSEVVVTVGRVNGDVLVSVADQGPGIAPEDLEHIFERFYQANGRRKDDQQKRESLGLGLYITRMLVEAHGGRIWATSEPGVGSTFCFTLPTEG